MDIQLKKKYLLIVEWSIKGKKGPKSDEKQKMRQKMLKQIGKKLS